MTARHALKFTTNQRCYSDFFRALLSVWIGLVTGKILTALWKPLNILQNLSVTNHFLSSQPSVRKTHNGGRKHKENVRFYYTKWMEEQAQSLIDQTSMQLFFFSVQFVDDIQNSIIHKTTVNVRLPVSQIPETDTMVGTKSVCFAKHVSACVTCTCT